MRTTAVLEEEVVPFGEAGRLPGSPTRGQIQNWRDKGIWVKPLGQYITIEWCSVGGRPVTSVEAYKRFVQRTNLEPVEEP